MKLNYANLRPMDCVCISGSSLLSKLIRLFSAGAKHINNMGKSNHVGLIVEIGGRYWIAEMLGTGLEINSLHDYTKQTDKNKVVAVKRLQRFDDKSIRDAANEHVIALANDCPPSYDVKGIAEFLGLSKDSPSKFYCSEFAEFVVNRFGATWDRFNLQGKKSTISPIQIQNGRGISVDFEV